MGFEDRKEYTNAEIEGMLFRAREEARSRYREDAQNYHKVMGYLRAMRKEHGLCQPRERKACTACNAKDNLDVMVDAYKGAPIRLA